VTWEKISPDLTANDPKYQNKPSGEPITIDVTGEEYYSVIYAIEESPLEPGVIWTGSNDGTVLRHARQRQVVDEDHAEDPAARLPRAEHRPVAASARLGVLLRALLPAR
jgi:hypothetical protein